VLLQFLGRRKFNKVSSITATSSHILSVAKEQRS
jgi:hypothetical protein